MCMVWLCFSSNCGILFFTFSDSSDDAGSVKKPVHTKVQTPTLTRPIFTLIFIDDFILPNFEGLTGSNLI